MPVCAWLVMTILMMSHEKDEPSQPSKQSLLLFVASLAFISLLSFCTRVFVSALSRLLWLVKSRCASLSNLLIAKLNLPPRRERERRPFIVSSHWPPQWSYPLARQIFCLCCFPFFSFRWPTLFKDQFGCFGPAAVAMLILTLFDSRCRRCFLLIWADHVSN